jgi:hypothetical protein
MDISDEMEGRDTGFSDAGIGVGSKADQNAPSDFSIPEEDQFFGADFSNRGAETPVLFLEEQQLTPQAKQAGSRSSKAWETAQHMLPIPETSDHLPRDSSLLPKLSVAKGYRSPDTGHQCKATIPRPAKGNRQVGVARVKVEILSLSRSTPWDQLDDESQSSDEDTDTEGSLLEEGGGPVDGGSGNSAAHNQSFSGPGGPSSSSIGANTNPSNYPTDEGGSGFNNDRSKKPRGKAPKSTSASKENKDRFACPYQAFDRSQNCFKPGPRNRNGGCAGIQRLK